MGIEEIAKNVYANVDYDGGNVACINTGEGIVLVDTPTLPKDIEDWKAFVNGLNSKGIKYIINTHIHFDHIMGNNRIGGNVIMHQKGREQLFKKGAALREMLAEKTPIWLQEDIDFILNEPLISPTITMSEKMTLYLGEYTLRLDHIGGHTPDSILVYVVEDRILITGDNLTAGHHPYKGEASFVQWIQALDHMKTYDIDRIIPGHGAVCKKEEIDVFITYFRKQWDLARDLIQQGFSRDEVIDKVREEMFDFFPVEPERMAEARMMFKMGTIQLYQEIQGSL